jgi:hypothetical protein
MEEEEVGWVEWAERPNWSIGLETEEKFLLE